MPAGHHLRDQHDLLGRRDVERDEQRADRGEEQLAAVGVAPPLLLLLLVARAELAARQHRADAAGHRLQRELADDLGRRHVVGQRAEQQQHRARGDERDGVSDQRVQREVLPAEALLEARIVGEPAQHRQHDRKEQRELSSSIVEPRLHISIVMNSGSANRMAPPNARARPVRNSRPPCGGLMLRLAMRPAQAAHEKRSVEPARRTG